MQVPYLAHPWGCHLHPFGSLTAIFFKSYALKKKFKLSKKLEEQFKWPTAWLRSGARAHHCLWQAAQEQHWPWREHEVTLRALEARMSSEAKVRCQLRVWPGGARNQDQKKMAHVNGSRPPNPTPTRAPGISPPHQDAYAVQGHQQF